MVEGTADLGPVRPVNIDIDSSLHAQVRKAAVECTTREWVTDAVEAYLQSVIRPDTPPTE